MQLKVSCSSTCQIGARIVAGNAVCRPGTLTGIQKLLIRSKEAKKQRSRVFHKMTRVKKRVRLWPFTGSEKNKNPASGSASASSDLQLQPLT